MKAKPTLLAISLFSAGALAAQLPGQLKVVITVDTLLDRAAVNRTISRALAPVSDCGAAYFMGRADAMDELAATADPR